MKRIKYFFGLKRSFALVLVISGAFLTGCEKYVIEGPEKPENVSFATDIIPIFTKNCISCHGGAISPNFKAEFAYSSITTSNLVSVSTPESSKLYDKLLNSSTHQSKTTPLEELTILTWIEEGAKNN
jgi:hypothetical protein